MSRFFLITAQTKEFPAMLVMISTVVTIVTAVSVDSHMTLSVLVAITEIRRNMYFAKDIPITFFTKRIFSGSFLLLSQSWATNGVARVKNLD